MISTRHHLIQQLQIDIFCGIICSLAMILPGISGACFNYTWNMSFNKKNI